MISQQKNINSLIIIIISCILLGGYGVQIFKHEQPCPLCLLQRIGMIGVAAALLLNVQFEIRMSHYGIALLSAIAGQIVALRHIALHICTGDTGGSTPVFGLSLYTWSFIIFMCCIFAIALLICSYDPYETQKESVSLNLFGKIAFGLIFMITFANILTTLAICGWGPCE